MPYKTNAMLANRHDYKELQNLPRRSGGAAGGEATAGHGTYRNIGSYS